VRDEHVDVEPKQLLGERGQPVVIALRPAELDEKIATFDPAEIAKSSPQRRDATRVTGRGHKTQEADARRLGRLRVRRERPRRRRAAQERDKLAPFQLTELHVLPQQRTPWHHTGLARIK